MKDLKIVPILKKSLAGKLSLEEKELIDKWLGQSAANRKFFEEIQDNELLSEQIALFQEANWREAYERFAIHLQKETQSRRAKLVAVFKKMTAAAVLISVIALGVYFLNKPDRNVSNISKTISGTSQTDMLPIVESAQLTLADGTIVKLDGNQQNQLLAKQGQKLIVNNSQELTYSPGIEDDKNVLMNTVQTGTGGMYKLVLADGTKVILNSQSSLKFPVNFSSTERKVELMGQAYFEVTEDKRRPFTVITNSLDIKVLGTKFDIKAYNSSRSINTTTLLEGSIMIFHDREQKLLKPNQQASIGMGKQIKIGNVTDAESVIAWTKGKFSFNKTPVEDIFEELKRNYPIKNVRYEGVIDSRFSGQVPKDVPLSEVLKVFSMTGLVHFKIEGDNEIVVTP